MKDNITKKDIKEAKRLTDTFQFVSFPKPIKPPKKTMREKALYYGIRRVLKSRQAIKDRIAKYATTSVKVGRKHKKRQTDNKI